ncbi:hypothetical protein [Thiomicrorhabdus chilensis]|uniref:hypothetical protein n=1 Tax=Thiomicrorhabdus chilensis TaxID=63656 RepID=UPI000401078B|nr:hypothetical protein [Thiomicrorhabdus chilensis]
MKNLAKIGLMSLSFAATAGDYQVIENPPANGLVKDSFVVTYSANDFTDKIDEAKILFIPENFRTQPAFLLRCRPYYTNFSVQFLETEKNLQDSDGTLTNEAASFAKHGYIYNADHDLTISVGDQDESMDILVGGQNKHLTQLFKTDLPKPAGLLGMSFYFTFNYKEMPSFRNAKNNSDTRDAYRLLKTAVQNQQPLILELDGRNAPDRRFTLDSKRLNQAVPPEVIEFCLTGRELID